MSTSTETRSYEIWSGSVVGMIEQRIMFSSLIPVRHPLSLIDVDSFVVADAELIVIRIVPNQGGGSKIYGEVTFNGESESKDACIYFTQSYPSVPRLHVSV